MTEFSQLGRYFAVDAATNHAKSDCLSRLLQRIFWVPLLKQRWATRKRLIVNQRLDNLIKMRKGGIARN